MELKTRQTLQRFHSAMTMYKKHLEKVLPTGEIVPAAIHDMILEAEIELQLMDAEDDASANSAP